MGSEHRARVVPYSASPEDTTLTLVVECFERPQRPLRWGHLPDTRENVIRLDDEAVRHNRDFAEGHFGSSSESGGTIATTTDESEKP